MSDKTYVAYPSVDIYVAIDGWLDEMIEKGKLKMRDGNMITRGDIGQLNVAIKTLLVKKNLWNCDIKG